jgi:hypothetical protein
MKKMRKRDSASFQQSTCFDGEELLEYRNGGLPAEKRTRLFYHLNVEKCRRCRDLYRMLNPGEAREESPNVSGKIIERLRKAAPATRRFPAPIKIERGQIWTTSPRPKSVRGEILARLGAALPVLVISGGNGEKTLSNTLRVALLSFDTEYELEGETVFLDSGNPLNYPILLEIFNERPMLAGNLDEYRGLLSSEDLGLIMEIRAQFLDGRAAEPDEDYLAWKEKEINLAEYLSFPVNEAIWEEEEIKAVDIPVVPYRKAAATSEEGLSDVEPHVLLKTDGVFLGIVQIRDRFLLRLVAGEEYETSLPPILVETRPVSLEQIAPGVHEVLLGYADQIPETMQIRAEVEGRDFVFQIRFSGRKK